MSTIDIILAFSERTNMRLIASILPNMLQPTSEPGIAFRDRSSLKDGFQHRSARIESQDSSSEIEFRISQSKPAA
jgi:bifunctional ADP-heptose synthase (sugar kinase/adenylyltransferase)